jgi:hypothetical protein
MHVVAAAAVNGERGRNYLLTRRGDAMKCPICRAELTMTEYHDDHIIMESETVCSNCQRYKEYFAYGNHEAGVKLATGWKFWQWGYDVSVEQRGRINTGIAQAAEAARREYYIEHAIGRFAS